MEIRSFAVAALRRFSYRWPARGEALKLSRVSRGKYQCAICKDCFSRNFIQVDHISPVVPITGWDGFDGFILRLLCPIDGYQILCKPCHKSKSKAENAERQKVRNERKASAEGTIRRKSKRARKKTHGRASTRLGK